MANNVLKFPNRARSFKPPVNIDTERIKEELTPNGVKFATAKSVFLWFLYLIRVPVFLVLYWLRLPVVFVCNLISIPMLCAWLFAWYAFPDKTHMVWGFATVSFTAFVVAWCYDFVLMAISPQDMQRML